MTALWITAIVLAFFIGDVIGLTVGCLLAAGKHEDVAAGREER